MSARHDIDLMQIAQRLITAALVESPKATQVERDAIDVDVVLVEAIDDLRAIQRARQRSAVPGADRLARDCSNCGGYHPGDESCI